MMGAVRAVATDGMGNAAAGMMARMMEAVGMMGMMMGGVGRQAGRGPPQGNHKGCPYSP